MCISAHLLTEINMSLSREFSLKQAANMNPENMGPLMFH